MINHSIRLSPRGAEDPYFYYERPNGQYTPEMPDGFPGRSRSYDPSRGLFGNTGDGAYEEIDIHQYNFDERRPGSRQQFPPPWFAGGPSGFDRLMPPPGRRPRPGGPPPWLGQGPGIGGPPPWMGGGLGRGGFGPPGLDVDEVPLFDGLAPNFVEIIKVLAGARRSEA